MKKIPVLITGMGGPLGISFLKALRMSDITCEIIGTDADPISAGFHFVDKAVIVPDARCEPYVYIEKIIELCRKYNIKMIFTGSDAELMLLAKHKELIESQTSAFILVNENHVIETACDKWQTVQYFKQYGVPVPDSILPGDWATVSAFIQRHGFPLVVKPRSSSGSKGLFIVESEKQLEAALNLAKNAVIQECLQPPDQEYTVGVFMRDAGNYLGSIILHRCLGGGLTYKARVSKNPEIERVAKEAVTVLRAIGPINVQLRLTNRGPVIFEINPRMSSSTVMRAHFGFNEPEMAIKLFVLGQNIASPKIKNGVALRYWEEIYQ